MSFYHDHYVAVRDAVWRMMLTGIRFDQDEASRKATELEARKEAIKDELDALLPTFKLYTEKRHRSPLIIKLLAEKKRLTEEKNAIPKEAKSTRKAKLSEIKALEARTRSVRLCGSHIVVERGVGLSDQRIAEYLYRVAKATVYRKRRKESNKVTETVDDVALKKVKAERGDLASVIDLIQEHRKCGKLLPYLDPSKLHKDGRLRSFYKTYGTQTGRFASSEMPDGKGNNLQNYDRSLKYLFIPDEG